MTQVRRGLNRVNTKYLYVMGSESGAGKSTVCLGILAQLMVNGYLPGQLAYIKPVTQCLKKQAIALFCDKAQIPYRDIGDLVFRSGFSREFIAGHTQTSDELMAAVLATIFSIGQGKSVVLVDGVGDPSVGSVVGVSNADVAAALSCRVLFVGKPGIGAAIDNTLLCVTFMRSKGIDDIGLIYNKVPVNLIFDIRKDVTKRISELLPNATVFGFIGEDTLLDYFVNNNSNEKIADWFASCVDVKALLQDWLGLRQDMQERDGTA